MSKKGMFNIKADELPAKSGQSKQLSQGTGSEKHKKSDEPLVTFRASAENKKRLRVLALERNTTVQALIDDGLNLLMAELDQPPFVEKEP